MGNAHRHHPKHRFPLPHNTVPIPPHKYPTSHPPHNPPNQNQGGSSSNTDMISLPYTNADTALRSLAAQAEGYGRFAIGGLHGSLYHVTSLLGICYFLMNLLKKFGWNNYPLGC